MYLDIHNQMTYPNLTLGLLGGHLTPALPGVGTYVLYPAGGSQKFAIFDIWDFDIKYESCHVISALKP
jgi:hypothetical protein